MKVPISVVVPLYNKALYIGRCLESIRRQTFTEFEAIVVDDGSIDGSGAIAAGTGDPRIRVVRQPNRGEGAARNRGIAEAKADLIAFLDGDDAWESGFLEAIIALSRTYPDAGWLATGYRRCMGSGWDREVTIRMDGTGQTQRLMNYLVLAQEGDLVTSSSVTLRSSALNETGGFVEGESIGADQDLWVRLASRYPLAFDNRILAVYYSTADGRVSTVHPKPAVLPAMKTLGKLLSSSTLPEPVRRDATSFAEFLFFKHATGMLYDGDKSTVETVLRTAPFVALRFRLQAALLRLGLKFLPMRVIAAIRLKPAAFIWRMRQTPGLRRLVFAVETFCGRTLILRLVRASNH